MKLKYLAVGLSLSCLLFGVSTINAAMSDNQSAVVSADQKQADGEVFAWLIAINKNEIAAAELARHKTTNKQVKDFANLMIKAHNQNLQQTIRLSHQLHVKPEKTSEVIIVEKEGAKEKSDLKKLNNKDFEKAYINDMVTGHEKALSGIDNALQHVNSEKLKMHLENTRVHVKDHLAKAKNIRDNLANN